MENLSLGEIPREIKPEKKQQNINKKNYHLITNEKEIDEWINEAEEAGELAIDTETSFVRRAPSRIGWYFFKY